MKEIIKELFFNHTLKRWHFEEIVKKTTISRERVNFILKKLIKENLIIKIKPKKKMPYYIANRDFSRFRYEKRLFGLEKIKRKGLFEHLNSLKEIKTAILFGSFSRGDWNNSSDIDLFLYGDSKDFEKGKFEKEFKREIQVFNYKNCDEMRTELDPNLIHNIAKGFNIKNTIEPFEVRISEKI